MRQSGCSGGGGGGGGMAYVSKGKDLRGNRLQNFSRAHE